MKKKFYKSILILFVLIAFSGLIFGMEEKEKLSMTCSICLQEINEFHDVETTPCNHNYHKDCLTGWTEEHSTCPICRAKLPTLKCLKNAIISRNYSAIQQIIDQKRELIDSIGRIDQETPLMFAVEYRTEEMVQFLIDQNANVRYQNEEGITALMIAAVNGNVNIAEKIILKDATTLDQVNHEKITPLMIAVACGGEELVQFLIDQNANVKYQPNEGGDTVLMFAAQYGFVNIAEKILLKDKTTLDQLNHKNYTPLMIAVEHGREEMVHFLIDQNVNVGYQNEYGLTPLMIAAHFGDVNIAEKIILKDKTTLDQVDNEKFTPIMFAVLEKNEEMVQFLIDQHANLKYQNYRGYTALMIAAQYGFVNIAKLVILKDATTLDQVNNKNFTLLMIAVEYRSEQMVQFLIDQNANVRYQNEDGVTALMIAVDVGNVRIAEKIILKDATTLDQVDNDKFTPLMVAVLEKNEEMVHLLIDQNANLKYQNEDGYTSLMIAAQYGFVNIAKLIILKDVTTLDQVDNKYFTPLMIAVDCEIEEMVQFLINQNANVRHQNEEGITALMIAAVNGNVNIAEKIILKDATTLAQVDNSNFTLLMIAVACEREEMVQFLIDQNANVRYKNEDGVTALMIAAQYGSLNIAKLIIRKDATTLDQVDKDNLISLMAAFDQENEEMVQFLIDQNANVKY